MDGVGPEDAVATLWFFSGSLLIEPPGSPYSATRQLYGVIPRQWTQPTGTSVLYRKLMARPDGAQIASVTSLAAFRNAVGVYPNGVLLLAGDYRYYKPNRVLKNGPWVPRVRLSALVARLRRTLGDDGKHSQLRPRRSAWQSG